jgi:alginate O-acetyltransferase complex protein AlgI
MVFSSHLFLFYFLPVTLLLYYGLPRGKHLVLALLSYVFYGWANPLFVVLLLVSTVVDYFCGLAIVGRVPAWVGRLSRRHHLVTAWDSPLTAVDGSTHTRSQRLAVFLSVCSNVSLLGFFKYFNFASDNIDVLAEALGAPWLRLDMALRVTLPLGISFYTFQSMSYTIDIYRGRVAPLQNFIDFACYVSMFPQLVAGPILRFSEVADQLLRRTHTVAKFARGGAFVSVGLAKKVLIANPCGHVADLVFDAGTVTTVDAWFGVTAYAFQIYFDFSAYSDMAIGLGLMLGFVFPKNFDSPYRARSITEFWQRWHISLSTWLRDYVYVPLGGNRLGAERTYLNLAVVMLLGGLWHGAAWTFVVWGGLHGALLAFERLRRSRRPSRLPDTLRTAVTFATLLVTWVFFRAADLPSALVYLQSMAGLAEPIPSVWLLSGVLYQPYYVATFVAAAVIVWWAPQTWDWTRQLTPVKAAATLSLLGLSVAVLSTQAYNPFIYFIF